MEAVASGNPLQRNAQWFSDRVGCVTASNMASVMNYRKDGKPGSYFYAYRDKLVAERLTGKAIETPTNSAMQWGIDHEEEARHAYEAVTGNMVDLCGFVRHETIDWLGASPDGLVGDDGLVEIKCPSTTTHINNALNQTIDPDYILQMTLQLAVTGRKWCDFVSYDPRIKNENGRIWIKRFTPTQEELDDAITACTNFLTMVQNRVNYFNELYGQTDEQKAPF